jgi:PAS domain S-box-containing protein
MKAGFQLTEHNYRDLFENASDAMWVQDLNGNIVDANVACEGLAGFTRQELLSKNVKDFLSGKSLELAREVRRNLLGGKETTQRYEQQLVRKDGTRGIMKMATSLVVIDGEIKGFQHIARDVTEERRMQEMLLKITDGSPIPTFVINEQHKVTHWNTAMQALSGVSSQEMVGTDKQWKSFYTEKRPVMADLIADGASAEEITSYYPDRCEKSRLIDGAYEAEDFFPAIGEHGTWLHFTASPIKNEDGEIIGAIETLQDITEGKQLQENMRFYVEQITKAQEDERKRIARELHDETSPPLLLLIQQVDALTSSTKHLSKSLAEALENLRRRAIEALEGLRRCAQDLRPRILDDLGLIAALEWMAEDLEKNYGIDTKVEVAGIKRSFPDEVQVLLFRIAQEAMSNIRRHAGASKAEVKLESGPDSIKMTISDDGKGFKLPDQVNELARTGRLGIVGMSERARLLGGNLTIKSKSGKGTRVFAEIPLPEHTSQ